MNLQVPHKAENLWSSWLTTGFSRDSLPCIISLLLNQKWRSVRVAGSASQDVTTSDAIRHETAGFHSTEQSDSGLLSCDNWIQDYTASTPRRQQSKTARVLVCYIWLNLCLWNHSAVLVQAPRYGTSHCGALSAGVTSSALNQHRISLYIGDHCSLVL
jgi:hypothetical protein